MVKHYPSSFFQTGLGDLLGETTGLTWCSPGS